MQIIIYLQCFSTVIIINYCLVNCYYKANNDRVLGSFSNLLLIFKSLFCYRKRLACDKYD